MDPSLGVAAMFAANLVRTRKIIDLSQEEVGVRASLHRTEISQLERGLRVARIDTLVKLCGAIEAEPNELLSGIVWDPGDVRVGRFRVPENAEG